MFERFTDRARRVLVEAQTESAENRHGFLGTEHILLGLMRLGEGLGYEVLTSHGVAIGPLREKVFPRLEEFVDPNRKAVSDREALASIGIDLDSVRSRLEEAFGPGALPDFNATPAFTPKAKESLERSLKRALILRHRYIGTEHVLLGVLEIRDGVACQALLDLGVDLDALDARVVAQAAPEQKRVSDAWQAITDLRRRVQALDDAQRDRIAGALDEMGRRFGAAVSSEQEQVDRLAAETATELEAAFAAAKAALAEAGIEI